MDKQDEFYIGWQEKAPQKIAQKGRRFVWVILVLSVLLAFGWVSSQRGFADSKFELGKLSEIEGVLTMKPAPMLKLNYKGQIHSVVLIGFGKYAAEASLKAIEEQLGESLEGKAIRLRGTLIYHNGKTLLELTEGVDAYIGASQQSVPASNPVRNLGQQSLMGEILDPKCALGVMKPGFGKPHRSCAVRCLSGGIPAVMRIKNSEGEENYCLIVGQGGEPINEDLLPYVADQVRICGELRLEDDWLVLYTDPSEDLLRLQPYWAKEEIPMCSSK